MPHIILLIVLFLIAIGGMIAYALHRMFRSYAGPIHIYAVSNAPPFLTESLALDRAQEALRLDGLDPAIWKAVADGRTKASDGRPDGFLSRNMVTTNRGVIMFTNLNASIPARFVSIELDGGRIISQVSIGK
jgi:hypothetical protein